MKKNFTASLMKKIHKQKISPRERFYFVARNIVRIASLIFFLLFGMLAVAMVWHLIHNFEFLAFIWETPKVIGKLLWFGVPMFWLIVAVALWVVTEKLAQQTDRAYLIPFWMIGGMVLLLQVMGGFILEQSQVGERLDQALERRMDHYQGAERMNLRMERMPENGFLVGVVKEVKSESLILLNDMTAQEWEVSLVSELAPRFEMKEGIKIRMMGEMVGDLAFEATSWRLAKMRNPEGRPRERRDREGRSRRTGPPSFDGSR